MTQSRSSASSPAGKAKAKDKPGIPPNTPPKTLLKTPPKTGREKVATHRAKLRAQGLRPVQIWVPDVRSPEFAAEARRQMRNIARSPRAREDQDFIDAIADWSE